MILWSSAGEGRRRRRRASRSETSSFGAMLGGGCGGEMDTKKCHELKVDLGIQAGSEELKCADGCCSSSCCCCFLPPPSPLLPPPPSLHPSVPCRHHTEKLTIVGSNHTLVLNAERVAHREPLMYSTIWGQPPHPSPLFDVLPLLPLAAPKCIQTVSHESDDRLRHCGRLPVKFCSFSLSPSFFLLPF